jgi:3-oxoacyl-[acyl-carrier-protein] synthase-3
VAACVPKNKVDTKQMTIFTKDECDKFLENVGIESRRVATEGVCASDLCFKAAEKLIDELHWDRSEIDALVFVSVTADYRSPMTSCILQDRLGLPNTCFTLDIPLGCCGYLHGLTILSNLMIGAKMKKALLLAGDTCYQMSSPEDKSRLPIFGDAGTASALEYDEKRLHYCISILSSCEKNRLIGSHRKRILNILSFLLIPHYLRKH